MVTTFQRFSPGGIVVVVNSLYLKDQLIKSTLKYILRKDSHVTLTLYTSHLNKFFLKIHKIWQTVVTIQR